MSLFSWMMFPSAHFLGASQLQGFPGCPSVVSASSPLCGVVNILLAAAPASPKGGYPENGGPMPAGIRGVGVQSPECWEGSGSDGPSRRSLDAATNEANQPPVTTVLRGPSVLWAPLGADGLCGERIPRDTQSWPVVT